MYEGHGRGGGVEMVGDGGGPGPVQGQKDGQDKDGKATHDDLRCGSDGI